jgi:hypothetical protein
MTMQTTPIAAKELAARNRARFPTTAGRVMRFSPRRSN